jgi:ABC-type sugar transport system permease subunit
VKFGLGLYLAVLLNNHIPFKAIIRAVVLLPFIVPTVLSAIAFWWIYDAQFSIVSWSLVELGWIGQNIDFLGDPENARASVVVANVWRGIPFVAITLLAGLQTVPPSLYEAARIDGASRWQMFRYITYPMLTPIIAIVMTFSVLFTFTDFQLIYALTRGGPANATHLMATLSFQRAIMGGALGEGAAISTAMIPFLLAAILFSWFGLQRRKWQQGEADDLARRDMLKSAGSRKRFIQRWRDARALEQEGMSYLSTLPQRVVTVYMPIGIFLIVLLFPFYWMGLTSIKPNAELLDIQSHNPWWVVNPTLAHYRRLIFDTDYPAWLWNTLFVAVIATFLSLAASIMAAYAIVRIRYTGARWIGLMIFLAYLVPPSILFIPLSIMVAHYGLFDSPFALILTYPTILIPFSTWLLMGYFKSIPYELEECALIDGATRWQILVKIVLPLSIPGIISAGILR